MALFHGSIIIWLSRIAIPLGCLGSYYYERISSVRKALFVFGDSHFDAGNNDYINITAQFQANWWPYSESFFNPPSGRFSDGHLILDFIAEYLKLPLIPSYFEIGEDRFVHGVNFASGGSGCLAESYPGFVIDLKSQLKYFKKVVNDLKKKFGEKKSKRLLSNAVYMFSVGTNDYNNFINEPNPKDEYVKMVIGNLTSVLKGIYEEGGRKFAFLNLGPSGCTPGSRALNKSGDCIEEPTTLAKIHNSALSKMLKHLDQQLPGFKYSLFDFFKFANERIDNPSKYGFTTSKIACCGTGPSRGIYSCGGKREVKEYELCENVKEYMFFDSGHLTEVAYKQVAELMWKGTMNVIEPYNLNSFFNLPA